MSKTPVKVMCKIEGYTDREECKYCESPVGFCEHSIEEKYIKFCPSNGYSLYQLRRSLAIAETEKHNLSKYMMEDKKEQDRLNDEINVLRKELDKYKWLDEKITGLNTPKQPICKHCNNPYDEHNFFCDGNKTVRCKDNQNNFENQ